MMLKAIRFVVSVSFMITIEWNILTSSTLDDNANMMPVIVGLAFGGMVVLASVLILAVVIVWLTTKRRRFGHSREKFQGNDEQSTRSYTCDCIIE